MVKLNHTICLLLSLLVTVILYGQEGNDRYARVKVFLHNTDIAELAELGFEYDHGVVAKGRYWVNDISYDAIDVLKENNLDFEILIENVYEWYDQQLLEDPGKQAEDRNTNKCNSTDLTTLYQTPENYTYGSMGGYHNYTELLFVLDDMKNKFPHLISSRMPIGNHLTQEGRPVYWLKIGINPEVDEEKPAILYNALHHAREPNSLSQMLFFMWHLLENYGSDEEVTYLLNQVELYFIPCLNPDGYIYNETIRPMGGGHWRKNRRVNDNGATRGVDLNRNYGFKWGFDNSGSSENPSSEIYRGPEPFSEPETKAIRDFCIQHQFEISLNYHSFSNLLIYPWGFESTPTPDHASFRAFGEKMTEQNNYLLGTGLETVGYIVNGDSDDWMYGEQESKPKILSFTPEVGPGFLGFWPPKSAIDGLNKDCLWQNITAAGLLKAFGDVSEEIGPVLTAESADLTFQFQNIGLEAGNFEVQIRAGNEGLIIPENQHFFQLAHLETQDFTISYQLTDLETPVQDLVFEVLIDNGSIVRKSKITKKYYTTDFISTFSDDVENELINWVSTGTWSVTQSQYFSEHSSITDSPDGEYANKLSTFIQTRIPIDLTDAHAAIIRFRAKWDLETHFDYVQLKIGLNENEASFIPVCGNFTGNNKKNEPAYNGKQEEWVMEEVDISAYVGQKIYVRFQIDTDDFVTADGFYFDDFSVEIITNPTTSNNEEVNINDWNFEVSPNPFQNFLQLSFDLPESTSLLSFRLLNTLGQIIDRKSLNNAEPGQHTIVWNTSKLKNGIYFLEIRESNHRISNRKIFRKE